MLLTILQLLIFTTAPSMQCKQETFELPIIGLFQYNSIYFRNPMTSLITILALEIVVDKIILPETIYTQHRQVLCDVTDRPQE